MVSFGTLKDEIERVGCNLDVIEPIIKGRHSTSTLDDDLKIVAEFLQRRPMRESIHMLSQILKSVPKKD